MNIAHPSTFLKPGFTEIIRSRAVSSERLGSLSYKQLQLIYEQQWFKLFVPAEYGGLEMPFPDSIRLQESLSWADGSMGWTVTLCSGAGWFAGFLGPELTREVFSSPYTCLGGSGAPTGTAILTESGYEVTGTWKYATGASHLTHFTANCIIEGAKNDEEKPEILSFIFDKKDVTVIKDWHTTGLIATGSHSFSVNQLSVPASRTFNIDPDNPIHDGSIFKYPFLQFAEATLAVNISGMALHFIDLCDEIFLVRTTNKKMKDYQQKVLHEALSAAKEITAEKRFLFYAAIERSWASILTEKAVAGDLLQEVSAVSRDLAKSSLQQINELYPYCGMAAANPVSEINRVWRDLHTASQHTLLAMPY